MKPPTRRKRSKEDDEGQGQLSDLHIALREWESIGPRDGGQGAALSRLSRSTNAESGRTAEALTASRDHRVPRAL